MEPLSWMILLVTISIIFDFLNGFNDSANIAATIISSRSMKKRTALNIAAVAGFAGPFVFGVAVAKTIGADIILPQFITIQGLTAALLSACIWFLITWINSIPSSPSHALIGGIIGATLISSGIKALIVKGMITVFIALFFAPLVGFLFTWLAIKIIYYLLKNASADANHFFKLGQYPTAIALAAGNAANDAQKSMGIITLALIITGYQKEFYVPLWVVFICAGAKSLGSLIGGWRIIRMMGTRFYKIKPVHSFTSQMVSSIVIILSSIFGGPVSTTQVVSMSIVGAGAGERISKVRWMALKDIFLSWILTIPFTAILAMLIYLIIKLIFY